LLCDLLWSDPEKTANGFNDNERGVSYVFSEKIVEDFNKNNDLDLIIRAHQVVEEGFEFFANRQLITIFSAPNYCGEFDNSAGILLIDESLICSIKVLRPVEKGLSPELSDIKQIIALPRPTDVPDQGMLL